jgi:hypothetical protein
MSDRLGGALALAGFGLGTIGLLWHQTRRPSPPPPLPVDSLRFSTTQSLTLQTRLLRGLPGPALLVRPPETASGSATLLATNNAAQATLPDAGSPALGRLVNELMAQSQIAESSVHRLDLPGGGCILWLPPSAPTPTVPPPAPPAPASADDDRAAIVYTVSHDLRAPIRVIEGFTRIVREDYGHLLDRVGNDHLERVLGAATRMNSMIDSLLALSRLSTQAIERVPVDLSALAQDVMSELHQQAPERQADLHITPGLTVQGDPVLLRSVLENLLGNAWKYASRRDVTRIEFGRADSGEFFVRDNGAGFDMRFAGKLFGAFQRLHGATEFPGTGIGLASVRRIIRRHGGDIRAEAAVNEGARFYFTLG